MLTDGKNQFNDGLYENMNNLKVPSDYETSSNKTVLEKVTSRKDKKDYLLYDGLKEIASECFKNMKYLNSVTAPYTLERIGESAFKNSTIVQLDLTNSSVEIISKMMFYNCEKFRKLFFREPIKVIEDLAFVKCVELENIDLSTVETIGTGAFRGCTSLRSISLDSLKTSIEKETFLNCEKLKFVEISDDVYTIKNDAFNGCTALKKINLKNVTNIGVGAFSNCVNLEEVITNNKIKFDRKSFENCPKLKIVFEDETLEKKQKEYDQSLFEIKDDVLIVVKKVEEDGCIVVPDFVKRITTRAFRRSDVKTGVKKIVLGSCLECLDEFALTDLSSLEEIVFNNSKLEIISNSCFSSSMFKSITLPNTITKISDFAFYCCSNLESISAPGVTSVGSKAFFWCKKLKFVQFSDGCVIHKDSFGKSKVSNRYLKKFCKIVK